MKVAKLYITRSVKFIISYLYLTLCRAFGWEKPKKEVKLTKKQQQEVDYLKTWCKVPVSNEQVEEYILATTKGKGESGKFSSNPLIVAQQRLGVTLAMWKEDMVNGIMSVDELLEEATCEYERNLIIQTRNSVNGNYRRKTLKGGTILSFTNFPDVMKLFK